MATLAVSLWSRLAGGQSKLFFGCALSRNAGHVPFSCGATRLMGTRAESSSQKFTTPFDVKILSFSGTCSENSFRRSSELCQDIFIRDPLLNGFIRNVVLPSTTTNKLLVYEDDPRKVVRNIADPSVENKAVVDVPPRGRATRKEAHRMIRIRRRKMRKHKLRKWRKKYRLVLEKRQRMKELRKEQQFRLELLTQIEEAEKFDAKEYVEGIIHKLRYHPKPPTLEQIKEEYRQLYKKNRSNVRVVTPRFDD